MRLNGGSLVPLTGDPSQECVDTVDVTTLDSAMAQSELLQQPATEGVDVLRLGASGDEARVIAGGTHLLVHPHHRPCAVLFTYSLERLKRSSLHPRDIFDILHSTGYRGFHRAADGAFPASARAALDDEAFMTIGASSEPADLLFLLQEPVPRCAWAIPSE